MFYLAVSINSEGVTGSGIGGQLGSYLRGARLAGGRERGTHFIIQT